MTIVPVRLQLSRAKGFNLQALSRATNGLEAVNVARPSKWGNPFVIGSQVVSGGKGKPTTVHAMPSDEAIARFRTFVMRIETSEEKEHYAETFGGWFPDLADIVRYLRRKNLACWCKPGMPCHADVLLEIANG